MELITIDQIQSHANDRSVALSVKTAKITSRLLAQTMQAFLKRVKKPAPKHGRQSLKSLTKQGASIDSVPISDDNIGSFKKVARKYNIDFSLKKDKSTDPPNWIVFFKAKDGKAIGAAFNEFSKNVLKEKAPGPSIEKELERFKNIAKGIEPPAPGKARDKGELEL